MKEIFKPIVGRPAYLVSNLGRVMSCKRRAPVLLSIRKNRVGYAEVEVFTNSKISFLNVAREVLAAFEGFPADPWLCVAKHKNGDLMDCRLDNLEWVVCETDDSYDPTESKRRGIKKPEHTKQKMSESKFNQDPETIEKAIISRKKTIEYRKLIKKVNNTAISDDQFDEMKDIYSIQSRLRDE